MDERFVMMNRLTGADIDSAAECLAGLLRPVTVIPLDAGSVRAEGGGHCQVWLALEFMQKSGSIYARGAANFLATHRNDGSLPAAGVVAALRGPRALAWAWAAKSLGAALTVVVPSYVPSAEVGRLRRMRARVRVAPPGIDPYSDADWYADATGGLRVGHGRDPLVAAGMGSIVDEIYSQVKGLDTVLVCGIDDEMVAGINIAGNRHGVRTVAVREESEGESTGRSAEPFEQAKGTIVSQGSLPGVGQDSRPTMLALSAENIHAAHQEIWTRYHLAAASHAAAGLAALTTRAYRPIAGERLCIILCTAGQLTP
ncbi:pyridoxal-phosphate dependent enzyme [Nocardia cyriacigeorgica]|uniref:pyridoxal-phosphate dependent enzyme n=1 Tax=Nocardia cyriacigeorgica TaxID=135487 RepID=UPI001894C161|nr:pyridoxal-phosphate dependent enzyme [Nocardia cyriacigeorgica]MBF6416865.1 pyridoxal-phosphate dependent enzyme [Nocardia cyriacigeorgica]